MIRILDIDIVHTNSLKSDIYGGIAGRLAGVPVVWHVRDSIDDTYLPGQVAKIFRWLARELPTFVIANSQSTLSKLNLPPTKGVEVVYSGIPLSSIDSVPAESTSAIDSGAAYGGRLVEKGPQSARVTMVGRIAEWKGQHVFIRAAAAVLKTWPEVKFQIVGAPLFGEQEYEQSLYRLTSDLGVENSIEFMGFRDDVPDIINRCDILVHASIIGEPFGQVVVEGMAAAKPVIATKGGALPEIVVEDVTGLLVDMGSDDQMADAIIALLSDPVKAKKMGIAGQQRVIDKFTIDKSAEKLHAAYARLMSVRRSTS